MSSFFSKFRTSKKKGQNPYPEGQYSNNSSQASLNRSHQSLPLRSAGQQPVSTPFKGSKSPQRTKSQPKQQFSQPQFKQNPPQLTKQTPIFLKQPFVRSALVKGSFQTIVELPRYVDLNEWLALNIFEFNSNITQFVSLVSDYIDDSHKMSAGPGFDYLWIDTNKQAVRLPAVTYIDYTMSWIASKFDDPALFPTKQGVPFPPSFPNAVKSIYVQLFRIFAYLTHHHYEKIVHLSLESHFNSLFCHFTSFGKTFNLLDRNEMAPLMPLINAFEAQGKIV